MIAGRNYRTVSDQCWNPGKRIADMGETGIARQVLSPMPELFSYWFAPDDAAQLLRYINDEIAAMVAVAPDRFIGLAAVPLQDPDLALRELEYAMRELKFAGVELGSNVNGVPLGDPQFDAFFAACEALDAAVFVHAVRPAGMERLIGPPVLEQVLGYPTDVGLCATSMLTTNLIERRPRLRIAFSHGGGTLASLLPRLDEGARVFPALGEKFVASPTAQARKFYYDDLVFSAPTLRHLVDTFGASQLLVGTDYPFNFREREPMRRLEEAGFDAATIDAVLHRNAERFLGRKGDPR
jgi:aminocarboxymuconate-semialdehyde decarboxylase